MSRDHFTFFVRVLAIFRSWIMIEKAHQRTVSHQRHNPICLIVGEFQPADPAQHNDKSQAQQAHADAVEFCRPLVNELHHGPAPECVPTEGMTCVNMVFPPPRKQATANPIPLNPTSPIDDKSRDSLAVSREAGRVALRLSRLPSQLAVRLSKSELKRLI